MTDRVHIILVNWNGWKDTVECLSSLFQLDYPDYSILVCDNGSSDGSLANIRAWLRGELKLDEGPHGFQSRNAPDPPMRPDFLELNDPTGWPNGARWPKVVLLQTGKNLGFAGGNNVALRLGLRDQQARYFWLLNNDTVVEPGALAELVSTMHQNPAIGMCGSLIRSYFQPANVQARGGKQYSRWTGRVREPADNVPADAGGICSHLDYVVGASMLVSRAFVETVGLMDESYFLYFEELDWSMRAQGDFAIGFAPRSVVYHKEGASIGSNSDRSRRSVLSDCYLTRNRVLFTRRFFPWALPTVLAFTGMAVLHRLVTGDRSRARAMLSSMLDGLATTSSSVRE